ncbi:hypothetical protein EC912_104238 [Luteibacter rhizovicinus]|uniref:Uncharacterized protein n=1 Tax=Luteibacter rhizovicinus TaxID=242606 RepID=A0A4R3YNY2_9GAMM|nr:hypothetical protein [Luteibacter rhizovicinus]TCV94041.1 hypothetical protein EC912_104238 [Luteibacter rhizovicinus]
MNSNSNSHSKLRVVAKAMKQDDDTGQSVYRSSYRILDAQGEEIETRTGTHAYSDITSAYNEAFALGHERLKLLGAEDAVV